jgi:hypothetical protein
MKFTFSMYSNAGTYIGSKVASVGEVAKMATTASGYVAKGQQAAF